MRAPAEFVVTRHLITHPQDSPAQVAKHARLHSATASNALSRIRQAELWTDSQLLAHLRSLAERPRWRRVNLRLPNPGRWLDGLDRPQATSGEHAAALDGFEVVPERHLVYVAAADLDAVIKSAIGDGDGALAPPEKANLILKTRDAWLYDEPPGVVERGQRLIDYDESKHVQLLMGLRRLG